MDESIVLNTITLTQDEHDLVKVIRTYKRMAESNNKSPFVLYFCGGWIRDKFLGAESKDLDIIMSTNHINSFSMLMEDIASKNKFKFKKGNSHVLNTTNCRGMLLLKINFQEIEIDIRELREDWTLEKDLATRDFKCNALYYNPCLEKVEDLVNGLADVRHKRLDVVNSFSDSFFTDFSRFIRIVRFKVTKKFKIAKEVEEQIKNVNFFEIKESLRKYPNCSDTVYNEIRKLFNSPHCIDIFEEMKRLNIFGVIFYNQSIESSDIEQILILMKKIEKVLSLEFSQHLIFSQLERFQKNMLFKYTFVYVALKNRRKIQEVRKMLKLEKQFEYLNQLFEKCLSIKDRQFYKAIWSIEEQNFHYPSFIVLMDRIQLEDIQNNHKELNEYYNMAYSPKHAIIKQVQTVPVLKISQNLNDGYKQFIETDTKAKLDYLTTLIVSENIPKINDFLLEIKTIDFKDISTKNVQEVIMNALNILDTDQSFDKKKCVASYLTDIRSRKAIPTKIPHSQDTFVFFMQSFIRFLQRK
jgi:tRNA nucleotidyltransferase/poly(A) polymerase